MTDREFAEELIRRLNVMISDEPVREVVRALVEKRVPVSREVAAHQSITGIYLNGGYNVGILGVLNGCCMAESIAAIYDRGSLKRFELYEPHAVCA